MEFTSCVQAQRFSPWLPEQSNKRHENKRYTSQKTPEDLSMLQWILTWCSRHAPTPQKQAERALSDLRMSLFQAEQRVLDAQFQASYYQVGS